jgi:hypothetical protein
MAQEGLTEQVAVTALQRLDLKMAQLVEGSALLAVVGHSYQYLQEYRAGEV